MMAAGMSGVMTCNFLLSVEVRYDFLETDLLYCFAQVCWRIHLLQ